MTMLYDVVLSYDGKAQNLYYAPFREGPQKGEYFFVEDDDDMRIHKAEMVFSGVDKSSSMWDILQILVDNEIYRIRSVIEEKKMFFYEDLPGDDF